MVKYYIFLLIFIVASFDAAGQQSVSLDTDQNKNHITVKTYKKSHASTPTAPNTDDVSVTVKYYDDFGKPTQTTSVYAGPNYEDLLDVTVYDNLEREVQKFQPYAMSNQDGSYDENYTNSSNTFYQSYTNGTDQMGWKDSEYEPNPLSRIAREVGAGTQWKDYDNDGSPDHPVTTQQRPNNEQIINWEIGSDGYPYYVSNYGTGDLWVTEVTNEEGATKLLFVDKEGKKVLERKQANTSATTWHDTYYVYDEFGMLRVVFSPEVFKNQIDPISEGEFTDEGTYFDSDITVNNGQHPSIWIDEEHSVRITDGFNSSDRQDSEWFVKTGNPKYDVELFDDLAYRYNYDEEGNLIEKKIPGTGWIYYVYDQWNRLVLTQDANMRSQDQWLFQKYDMSNRVIMEGITIDSRDEDVIRSTYQSSSNRYESLTDTYNSWGGYTNTTLPNANDQIFKISYYDNYRFLELWSDGNAYQFSDPGIGTQSLSQMELVDGQLTAAMTMTSGQSNQWIKTVNYFNHRMRPIQILKTNLFGNVDSHTAYYDFRGNVITDYMEYESATESTNIKKRYTYDHESRLKKVYHKINSEDEVLVQAFDYDELGRTKDEQLHSEDAGNTYYQSIDYAYNIRGWLTKLNDSDLSETESTAKEDYFGVQLTYNQAWSNIGNDVKFDGNISAIKWSQSLTNTVKETAYTFDYDPIDRLKSASLKIKNTSSWTGSNANGLSNVSYDMNGNIQTLTRTESDGSNMDDLSYNYHGNQLLSVGDSGSETGFTDSHSGIDYRYDKNGNLIADLNKNIESIQYNYLNLPIEVVKQDGEKITFTYDAEGVKLGKQLYNSSGSMIKSTVYNDGLIYDNAELQEIQFEKGRVIPDDVNGGFEYQYFLQDHLGNTRVVFTTKPKQISFHINYEESANKPDDADLFENVYRSNNDLMDHTDNANQYTYSQLLTGAEGSQVGSLIAIPVGEGDNVDVEAFAKYVEVTSDPTNRVTSLASALIGTFTGIPSFNSEASTQTINSNFGSESLIGTPGFPLEDGTAPKAFLNLMFLPEAEIISLENNVSFAYDQIDVDATQPVGDVINHPFDELKIEGFKAPGNGYVLVYVSNESETLVDVNFDDLKVTINEHPVIQRGDYYPFGLTYNSFKRISADENKYKTFQRQEKIDDLDLNWYSFKWRNHDPSIGRFFNVDPLSEDYYHNSVYAFSENKLIAHGELEGLESLGFQAIMKWAEFKTRIGPHQKVAQESMVRALLGNSGNLSNEQSESMTEQGKQIHDIMSTAQDIESASKAAEEVAIETSFFAAETAAESAKNLGDAVEIAGLATGQPEIAALGSSISTSGLALEIATDLIKTGNFKSGEVIYIVISKVLSKGLSKFGEEAVEKGNLGEKAKQIWEVHIYTWSKGADEVKKKIYNEQD